MSLRAALRNLRYAARGLSRALGFSALAVMTLALGTGPAIAVFAAIHAILLEPLPYPEAARVVTVWRRDAARGIDREEATPGDFVDWRERSRSFDALAAAEPYTMDVLGPDGPERYPTWRVTETFFEAMAVPALLGRALTSADYAPGAPPAVVMSHAVWRQRFGEDPAIVGRTLVLDGVPTTVVGVMPPRFGFPPGRGLWVPRALDEAAARNRTSTFWWTIGRLRDGVSLEAAGAELDAIAAQVAAEHPDTNEGVGAVVVPLSEILIADVRPVLLLFFSAVGLVLLIGSVNVANLLLARAASRGRELAVRGVLGADRGALIRELVAESAILGALGGLCGLALGWLGLGVIERLVPMTLTHVDGLGLDPQVALFAAALSFAIVPVLAVAPAWHAARADHNAALRGGSGVPTVRRFRRLLVTFELALAVVLLIGAGLLLRSFAALLDVERGYRTENVLALAVQTWRYYPQEARPAFVSEALERLEALPRVASAGVTSLLPLGEDIGADTARFRVAGRPGSGDAPEARVAIVTDDYFRVLDIALRAGRLFGADDRPGAPAVVLINEAMARRYWPSDNPIGSEVTIEISGGYSTTTTARVVGVVADVRNALDQAPEPSLYLPYMQHPTGALYFTIRTADDADALVRAAQSTIWAINPAMPIATVATIDGLMSDSLRERRVALSLVAAFSVAAVALAAVGTYGVLSFEAARRTREVGIRTALGATRRRVVRLVVGEGLRLAALGVAIGLLAGLGAARALDRFLFGVGAWDAATFAAVAAMLLLVAGGAALVPAIRAAKADPMTALRAD